MENEKLFDLMTQMYSEMKDGFKTVTSRLDKVETRLDQVESRLNGVEKSTFVIEQDHGQKLQALFEGWETEKEQREKDSLRIEQIKNKVDIISMESSVTSGRVKVIEKTQDTLLVDVHNLKKAK